MTRKRNANPQLGLKKPESKILTHVGAEDGRLALLVLAGRHPGLVPEIDAILLEHFAATTVAGRADEVVETIALLPSCDLEDGMTDDSFEPAYDPELVAARVFEAIEPYVDDVRCRAAMGLASAALVSCEGLLLGLYRADLDQVSRLLASIPDELADLAFDATEDLARVKRRRLPDSKLTVARALTAFAREQLPDWDWLHR